MSHMINIQPADYFNRFKIWFAVHWSVKRWRLIFISVVVFMSLVIIAGGLFLVFHKSRALGKSSTIKQEISLVNCPATIPTVAASCSTTSTTYTSKAQLGITTWNPNDFGGDTFVYFEVVGYMASGSANAGFELVDTNTNTTYGVTTINSTSPTRARTAVNLTGTIAAGAKLAVYMKTFTSSKSANLVSAKLIVIQAFNYGQMNMTDNYIELGSNVTLPANSTNLAVPNGEQFTYDASKYDGSLRFFLEATGWDPGASGYQTIYMYDLTSSQKVPMIGTDDGSASSCFSYILGKTDLCWSNGASTPEVISGEISGLISGHTYQLEYSTDSSSTGRLSLANLIIKQTPKVAQQQITGTAIFNDPYANSYMLEQTFVPSYSGFYSGFNAMATCNVASVDIYDKTTSSVVSGTQQNTTNLSCYRNNINIFFDKPVWLNSSHTYSIQLTPISGGTIQATYSSSDLYPNGQLFYNGAAVGGDLNFQLFSDQYPSKFETYVQLANSGASTTSTSYVPQNQLAWYYNTFFWSDFSRVTTSAYFEATLKASSPYSVSAQLTDGTGTISTSSTSYTTVRSGLITPSVNTEYDSQFKTSNASGTAYMAKSAFVVDVVMAPNINKVTPNNGPTASGALLTLYGGGFQAGATVKINGNAATNVFVVNSSTITATAPSNSAGVWDVVVTNPDGQTDTLTNGYTVSDLNQNLSKVTNAAFTTAGSSLSNLSSGIQIDMSNFLWQKYSAGNGGSMASGTYYYVVTALDEAGNQTAKSPQTAAITVSASGSVSLQWRSLPKAYNYKIYRTTTSNTYGASSLIATLDNTASSTINGYISYVDTAASTVAGQPPSNSTNGGLHFQYGSVPVSSGGITAGNNLLATAGAGAHAIKRSDGKFIIINGDSSTSTTLYDPLTNTISSGSTMSAAAGTGSFTMNNSDGSFRIIGGGGTGNGCTYNTYSGTYTLTNTFWSYGAGAHAIKLPDGKYLTFGI